MILDTDFQSFINVDYDYYSSCEEYGCNEEGICRCGEISNTSIKLVNVGKISNEIYSLYFDDSVSTKRNAVIQSLWGITTELNKYTIDRILRLNKIWMPENWEVNISNGYYGQEIEEVVFVSDFAKKLESEIEFALSINSKKELIYHLLKLEYGEVLDKLQDSKFEVLTIKRSDIIFGNNNHFQNVLKEDLDHYSDKNYSGIRGIVNKSREKFKLIDGYHRCSKTENEFVRVIVASK